MNKNDKLLIKKENPKSYMYLTRVKIVGIVGILLSLFLIGFDIYNFEKGWLSITSLLVDILLLGFSIYFILRSQKLMKIELVSIVKEKTKSIKKTKKNK